MTTTLSAKGQILIPREYRDELRLRAGDGLRVRRDGQRLILEKIARKILEGEPANLLETVAERIAAAILKQPRVVEVTVRVSKSPPLPNLNTFTVEITRPVEMRDLPR